MSSSIISRILARPLLIILGIGLTSAVIGSGVDGRPRIRPARQVPRRESQSRGPVNDRIDPRRQQRLEQGEPLGPPGRPFFTRLQIIQTLDLTPEQQVKARELRDTLGSQLQSLREKLEERRDGLNQAIYAEALDDKRIEDLSAAIREGQSHIIQIETRLEIAFRGILSSEQLQRLRELQADEMQIRKLQREVNHRERSLRQKLRGPRSNAGPSPQRP